MSSTARIVLGLCLGTASFLPARVDFSEALNAYDEAEAGPSKPRPKAKVAPKAAVSHAPSHQASGDPWKRLMDGNRRHQDGRWSHPRLNLARRAELAKGQHPVAAILSCADSRVPPELVFDQGLGDLFVVRVAGNVAGPYDRASLEYGVEHLHIGLLVVLGHESCGAVKASLDVAAAPESAKGLSPDLKALVQAIAPALKGAAGLDAAVHANARLSAERLLQDSAVLKEAVEAGHLKVVPARYDLDSGAVQRLD